MQNRINYLNSVQAEYLSILQYYVGTIESDQIGTIDFCKILDAIDHFWLPRIPAISEAVLYLSKVSRVRILSGVMYLGHRQFEHFYLKAFGDYQIVIDPVSKLEPFSRGLKAKYLTGELARITRNAFRDTIFFIENYGGSIYYLPIKSMVEYQHKDHISEVNSLVWMIISNIFNKDFANPDEFIDHFDSIQQIESSLPKCILPYFQFSENETRTDTLAQKMEKYRSLLADISDTTHINDARRLFIIALYSQLMQITDILLTSSIFDSGFLIRSNQTFNWMIILQELFSSHEEYGKMLREAVCFYVFRKAISEDLFKNTNFTGYSEKINQFHLDRKLIEYSDEMLRNQESKSFLRIEKKAKSLFSELFHQ